MGVISTERTSNQHRISGETHLSENIIHQRTTAACEVEILGLFHPGSISFHLSSPSLGSAVAETEIGLSVDSCCRVGDAGGPRISDGSPFKVSWRRRPLYYRWTNSL